MGKFEIRKTATGYAFDLHAANGEVIAQSEVYATKAACRKGIQGVIRCAGAAPVGEQEPLPPNPRFELFRDKAGSYRFRLRSRNGKVIATSQGYGSRSACLHGIESVRINTAEE